MADRKQPLTETLGWEFSHKSTARDRTTTYAFSPDHLDGLVATFSVEIDCRPIPNASVEEKRNVGRIAGEGVALSKILLGSWEVRSDPYRFKMTDALGPSDGGDDAGWDFDRLRAELLTALYRLYQSSQFMVADRTGIALDVGTARSVVSAVLDDLANGGEVEEVPDTGGAIRLTRLGADEARNLTESPTEGIESPVNFSVFLSHSGLDDALSVKIAGILRVWGASVFTTPESIPTGYWHPQIEAALKGSEHLVVILSEAALTRSTWVHQELGFFLGFKVAELGEAGQHRVHYVHPPGSRRPGMYEVIQGTEIQSLDRPEPVAKEIAALIGLEITDVELGDLTSAVIPVGGGRPQNHEGFSFGGYSSSSNEPEFTQQLMSIGLVTPINIFNLGTAARHKEVRLEDTTATAQAMAGRSGEARVVATWSDDDENTDHEEPMVDSHGRKFAWERPRDPGDEWSPIYVTFETDDGKGWAAVTYFRVITHSKGFPEMVFIGNPLPYGWVPASSS